MNEPNQPQPQRTAVSLNDILAKVKKATYTVLPDTTTTVCQLHMKNGYVILGTSACVDPAKFNKALGEKYAYEDAINKAWPLEGYLLAEEIYWRNAVNAPAEDFLAGAKACDLSGEGECEACQ